MANDRPTLYAGSTNNLARRTYEHKKHYLKGFTAKYKLDKLVYYEIFENVEQAIIREKQIKDLNRADKLELIRAFNPTFKDLYQKNNRFWTSQKHIYENMEYTKQFSGNQN